jgi:hypothetical protein
VNSAFFLPYLIFLWLSAPFNAHHHRTALLYLAHGSGDGRRCEHGRNPVSCVVDTVLNHAVPWCDETIRWGASLIRRRATRRLGAKRRHETRWRRCVHVSLHRHLTIYMAPYNTKSWSVVQFIYDAKHHGASKRVHFCT